jgi:hypothetical protein
VGAAQIAGPACACSTRTCGTNYHDCFTFAVGVADAIALPWQAFEP